jgi:hypothetical protein
MQDPARSTTENPSSLERGDPYEGLHEKNTGGVNGTRQYSPASTHPAIVADLAGRSAKWCLIHGAAPALSVRCVRFIRKHHKLGETSNDSLINKRDALS